MFIIAELNEKMFFLLAQELSTDELLPMRKKNIFLSFSSQILDSGPFKGEKSP